MTTQLRRRVGASFAGAALTTAALVANTAPAQAATGWTDIISYPGSYAVLACKRAVSGPFGPLWEITLGALTAPGYGAAGSATVLRSGKQVAKTSVTARDGQWHFTTIHASRLLPDKVDFSGGFSVTSIPGSGGGGSTGPKNPATYLATCD